MKEEKGSGRVIKFRAWEEKSKQMYDVLALDWGRNRITVRQKTRQMDDGLSYYTLLQFTGLHDKNGEHEIYEGDMLWSEKRKEHYEVVWEVCGFIARSEDDMFDLASIASGTVVAGNIYEKERSKK